MVLITVARAPKGEMRACASGEGLPKQNNQPGPTPSERGKRFHSGVSSHRKNSFPSGHLSSQRNGAQHREEMSYGIKKSHGGRVCVGPVTEANQKRLPG